MLQQTPHKPHGLPKTKTLSREARERVEETLRELAFVLKMTQKIREEIEADEDVAEMVALTVSAKSEHASNSTRPWRRELRSCR